MDDTESSIIERIYNLPPIRPFIDPTEHYEKIEACFRTKQCALILGPQGSGKTTTAVGFARKRCMNHKIVFLDAYSSQKLDFEYRQYAYEHLNIPTYNCKLIELIAQVKERLENTNVLFIFDDVRAYAEIEFYLQEMFDFAKVIITSSSSTIHANFKGIQTIDQKLLRKSEAIDFFTAKLPEYLTKSQVKDLVHTLDRNKTGQVYPGDVMKSFAFIKESGLSSQESLNELKSRNNVTKAILDYLNRQKQFQSAIDLIFFLSMLNRSRIPEEIINKLMLDESQRQIEILCSFCLVQNIPDLERKCFRLDPTTSREVFEWVAKEFSSDSKHRKYSKLLVQIDYLFDPEDTSKLRASRYYAKSVLDLLSLDISLTKTLDTKFNLWYKMGIFWLKYLRDPKRALENFNHIIDSIIGKHFSCSKSLESKVYLAKGECLDDLGEFELAIREKTYSLRIREELDQFEGCKQVIETMESLAKGLDSLDRIQEALNYDKRALQLKKNAPFTCWNNDLEKNRSIAHSFYQIGVSYYKLENYEEALKMFIKSYKLRKEIYPENNHCELFFSTNAMAETFDKLVCQRRAEHFREKADHIFYNLEMKMFRKSASFFPFNPNEPASVELQIEIGISYLNCNDYESAYEVLLEAYKICEKSQQDVNFLRLFAKSAYNLGQACLKLGNYTEGANFAEKALEANQKLFGYRSNNLEVANTMELLGKLYCKEGSYSKAEFFTLEACKIIKELFGENHSQVAKYYKHLAEIYEMQGKYKKSAECLAEHNRILKKKMIKKDE